MKPKCSPWVFVWHCDFFFKNLPKIFTFAFLTFSVRKSVSGLIGHLLGIFSSMVLLRTFLKQFGIGKFTAVQKENLSQSVRVLFLNIFLDLLEEFLATTFASFFFVLSANCLTLFSVIHFLLFLR